MNLGVLLFNSGIKEIYSKLGPNLGINVTSGMVNTPGTKLTKRELIVVSVKKKKKSKFEEGNLRVKKPRKLMQLLKQKVCNTNLKGFIIVSSKRQSSMQL